MDAATERLARVRGFLLDLDGTLYVSGRLRGNAKVRVRTELSHSARVQADLTTAILVVEEGAIFEGQCSMQKEKFSGPREVKGGPNQDLKKIV